MVSEQTQEVQGEGSTEVTSDTVDKDSETELLFTKLSSHRLSHNGTHTYCMFSLHLMDMYRRSGNFRC